MFDLTADQAHAASHDGGHLLIVAGAGTGKTSTLAARLAHLVTAGVPPERIMLLTFSRRAASELLSRAEQHCGQQVAGSVWGGTFHAIANRLLRRHGRALGLDPAFTMLDQADTADLLALVRDELDGDDGPPPERRRARKETLAAILSRCVNSRTPLRELLPRHFPWCAAEVDPIAATFRAYTARKRAGNVVDYDDLLLLWAALLDDPATGPVIAGRFDHVLVDEYQDTNVLQADLLAGLAAGGATLTAVGDDAQAIYGFRAASVGNILEFPERFGADVIVLDENHRSTQPVLDVANAVMAEAPRRHDKWLRARRAPGPPPALVDCADEHTQSAAVCRRILSHVEQGVALRRQAVLFRTGHHSDLLEIELAVRDIPFVKYGGLRFLEAAHVKDLLCALRLVENRTDELAWFRVLLLVDGIGPATARKVIAGAHPPPDDLVAALDAAAAQAGRPGAQVECIRAWLDPLVARRHRPAGPRLADLDRLTSAAAGTPTLERFLADLTLDPPASTQDLAGPPSLDDDVLTLSTIHSAKGGEWDVVHVIHLADGNLPSDLSTGDPEELEEERRLLYVALTRARDHLYLYAPLRYHHHRGRLDDAHGYAQRSRFLTEPVLARLDRTTDTGTAPADGGGDVAEPVGAGRGWAAVDARLGSLFD